MSGDRRDGGFTLLEALIAFVIAALALGVLFEAAGSALRLTEASVRLDGAVSRAQSHLDAAAVLLGSEGERVEEGEDGTRYHWRVRIVPVRRGNVSRASGGSDPPVTNAVRLYRIEVSEGWTEHGRDRAFRLTGTRLFVAPPAGAR